MIVVDDGSGEENLAAYGELWRGLDDRFRLQLPPVPDLPGTGPSIARNRGIRLARGRYVAFCDDDDYWMKDNHLSTAVEVLDGEHGDLFFANLESRDGDSEPSCRNRSDGAQSSKCEMPRRLTSSSSEKFMSSSWYRALLLFGATRL